MSLSPSAISDICLLYNIKPEHLKSLDGYYSYVYEYEQNDQKWVIKIKRQDQTDVNRLSSEVLWLNYLHKSGISVAHPVKNVNDNYIELINDYLNMSYYTISYIKAKGITPRDFYSGYKWYPQEFLENWGSYVGKLHKLSKGFSTSSRSFSRPTWQASIVFFDLEDFPSSQAHVVRQFNNTIKEIEQIPKTESNYGLIHNDLLEDNMHINEGIITAFDFEDSCFNWYVNDIAIAFFYPVCFGTFGLKNQQEYGDYFLTHFMKGYRRENSITSEALETIPLFLKIREMDNYSMYFNDPEAKKYEVVTVFMNNRQKRIEENILVIDLNFPKY